MLYLLHILVAYLRAGFGSVQRMCGSTQGPAGANAPVTGPGPGPELKIKGGKTICR